MSELNSEIIITIPGETPPHTIDGVPVINIEFLEQHGQLTALHTTAPAELPTSAEAHEGTNYLAGGGAVVGLAIAVVSARRMINRWYPHPDNRPK